jgi:hypothetical protein
MNVACLILSSLAVFAASACTDTTDPFFETGPNHVHIESEAGDPVGGGKTYDYTPANATIEVDRFLQVVALNLWITGADRWTIYLYPPDYNTELLVGSYDPALSFGGDPWIARMAVSKESTSNTCAKASGRFTFQRVEYVPDSKIPSSPHGVLTAIDATFEQRCNGATGSLRGRIHWRKQ